MNLLNWVRYCREEAYKKDADIINFAPEYRFLDEGEQYNCNEDCNPWHCVDCCDGFGMSCAYKMKNGETIPYYIPDPFLANEVKEWRRIVKLLPAPNDTQLAIRFEE